MTRYASTNIRAEKPWDSHTSAEKAYEAAAPRQDVWFTCERFKHRFFRTFSATADPTYGWDCPRCGSPALADGAPEGAVPGMVESKAGSGLGGVHKGSGKYSDVTPAGQLRKRRSKKDGDALLKERMDELAAMRGEETA